MDPKTRAWLDRALGDRRTRVFGVSLILIGVVGKLLLLRYSNIETVFVACLLAGSLLGRAWTVLVPLATLAILEPILWGTAYADYPLEAIVGITFFVVTGFLFVGIAGRSVKKRILYRTKSVALLTTISVPLTIAYDVWTDVGDWWFLARPHGVSLGTVFGMQIPFTVYHLLSSLILVPIFGTMFLHVSTHVWPASQEEPAPSE